MAKIHQVKSITHKLTEHSSVALQDDIFMRAFLSRTIEAPGLQLEVKKFLKEPKIQYLDILEKVFVDYRAMETAEHLQQQTQAFSGAARISRKAIREQNSTDVATKPPPILFRFPRNSENKIPSDIYTQVREWFKRAIKSELDRTDVDKEFLDKFTFKVPQSGKKPPYKGPRPGGSGGKYGNDYGDRRTRRSGYRSRSLSFDRDRYVRYDHDDNRNSSARRGAYRDRDRSRSPEPRLKQDQSGPSADRSSRRTSASFSPHGNSRNRYAWDKGLVNLVRMSKRRMHRIGDLVICKDENIIITDSGCDQSIINLNSFLVQSFTGIYYNVGGALQGMNSSDLEIVSDAFTLCTLPDDTKVLFQFNQCLLDTDPLQTETLLQPHQARAHGVLVDDCTKQHPSITGQPATQCIQIGSDKFEMYFYGWKTYFRVQKPTSSDLVKYPIYEIATSRLYSPQRRRHTRRSKPTKKDVDIDLWWAHLGYPTFEVTEATTIANTTQMIQTLQSETRE